MKIPTLETGVELIDQTPTVQIWQHSKLGQCHYDIILDYKNKEVRIQSLDWGKMTYMDAVHGWMYGKQTVIHREPLKTGVEQPLQWLAMTQFLDSYVMTQYRSLLEWSEKNDL
ncbi:hypothetical protein HW132_31970 [Brasilonema sp. CT11]|nr:hypothetical protein [Brasilonema sp. CT11]